MLRLGNLDIEEKGKKSMGMSARQKCFLLADIADALTLEGLSADAKCIGTKLKEGGLDGKTWSSETIERYLSVGRKIHACPGAKLWLQKWEFCQGDQGAFYAITPLRALAALPEPDMEYVCRTLFFEQQAGLRKTGPLAPASGHSVRYDHARVLKSILVRPGFHELIIGRRLSCVSIFFIIRCF